MEVQSIFLFVCRNDALNAKNTARALSLSFCPAPRFEIVDAGPCVTSTRKSNTADRSATCDDASFTPLVSEARIRLCLSTFPLCPTRMHSCNAARFIREIPHRENKLARPSRSPSRSLSRSPSRSPSRLPSRSPSRSPHSLAHSLTHTLARTLMHAHRNAFNSTRSLTQLDSAHSLTHPSLLEVRAAAAKDVAAAAEAKERARLARKRARAAARIEAAVQHVLRPDSLEGLMAGLAFTKAQAARDAESIAKGSVSVDRHSPFANRQS